jgi:hypothetical protein
VVRRFIVDCGAVTDFEGFVAAMNRGFIELVGGHWRGKLDAFNDYLSWPAESPYELVLRNATGLPDALAGLHPSAVGDVGDESSLWHVIQYIFADNAERVVVTFDPPGP